MCIYLTKLKKKNYIIEYIILGKIYMLDLTRNLNYKNEMRRRGKKVGKSNLVPVLLLSINWKWRRVTNNKKTRSRSVGFTFL